MQVGEVTVGAAAHAQIDLVRRRAIARAHSATHLTHQALRDALGPTAAQAGSENSPGRFRFDFGSPTAVPGGVLTDVEQKINEVLARELDVTAEVLPIAEAKRQGAIAEFGEKYGEHVRVVTIGDFSKELCGGTHVHSTAQLGLVKLLGESSIGSGVRRIEALVGVDAYNFLAREHTVVHQLTELLKGRPEELPEKISGMLARLKDAEKEIEKFRAEKVLQAAAGLAESAKDVRGVAVVTGRVPDGTTADDVKTGRVARLTDPAYPGRTTLMKLASLSSLWDYIRRAMPWNEPKSLKDDEVYAVTAYILNLGGVLPDRSNFFDARSDLTTDDVVRFGAELEAGHAAVAVLDRRSPAEQVIVSLAGLGGKAEIHRLTAGGLRLAAASAGSLPDREP